MIDTLRLNIPLSRGQWQKIVKATAEDPNWQWIQFQASTGEMRRIQVKGSAQMDENSYHRDICWFLPSIYRDGETCLTVEFSLPKLWYGHNIALLYEYLKPLELFKRTIENKFHIRLPKIETWQVSRVDICYAYKCPNQEIAQAILDSLKHLHFPRKKPVIRATSIFFGGATYSLKFYLKHPEFQAHDMREMLKRGYSLEYVNYLEQKAEGVLRVEASLRRKYLKRLNINKVFDLKNMIVSGTIVSGESDEVDKDVSHPDFLKDFSEVLLSIKEKRIEVKPLDTSEPKEIQQAWINVKIGFDGQAISLWSNDNTINITGTPILVHILNTFLDKFIGTFKMQDIDVIKQKLTQHYKPVKASRLVSFWLYVQRFGSNDAKAMFGKDSYYRSKRELKALGISLVEPPKVIDARDRFIQNFTFTVPNEYAVNLVDDERNMTNLLNLIPRVTEQ